MPETPQYRFYGELAAWWPLISPPEEYAEEAAYAADGAADGRRFRSARCWSWGAGAVTTPSTSRPHFAMTLVDLSDEMLDVSRRLNPDCEHVQGDMRTVRLGRDVRRRVRPRRRRLHDHRGRSAARPSRPPSSTAGPAGWPSSSPTAPRRRSRRRPTTAAATAPTAAAVRYLEWTWDPDPDRHLGADRVRLPAPRARRLGPRRARDPPARRVRREDWLRLLAEAGFEAEAVTEETTERSDAAPGVRRPSSRRPVMQTIVAVGSWITSKVQPYTGDSGRDLAAA